MQLQAKITDFSEFDILPVLKRPYEERVIDPTCGTAGFLFHAAEYFDKLGTYEEQKSNWQAREREERRFRLQSARRMARTAHRIARASLKSASLRSNKVKTIDLSEEELAAHVLELFADQGGRCKLSDLAVQFDGAIADPEMACSLDRIDSGGGYTRGNLQVVCNFINRWKSDTDNYKFKQLLALIRCHAPQQEVIGPADRLSPGWVHTHRL
ncbi:hypothetical protein [Rhizobium rhizogenes]|uniref:hypothetical protein n=1 Tax=Rhizobium rhizogenes TaxID=359 RepID=UPI0015744A57|nr:hypothetical protein [Rhizobium rhizogenes]NTH68668.1 hypothetical protein [Rhizobium rhizogenes]NTI39645.1 hypothetical protein [Rhizobium rhizogenes]WEO69868.1 hypothetical protein G6L54_032590 [Rhizobium rhizogenes]